MRFATLTVSRALPWLRMMMPVNSERNLGPVNFFRIDLFVASTRRRKLLFEICTAPIGVAILSGCSTKAGPANHDSSPATASNTVSEARNVSVRFPAGTATPSEVCGACHKAIFAEFMDGFGADLHTLESIPAAAGSVQLPPRKSPNATLHALSGVDPFPIHARSEENAGKSCNVCHFPLPFKLPLEDAPEIAKPVPRAKDTEAEGLTCASCHLTPEGKIRGPHGVKAPHETVAEPAMQTAVMCAYCHSAGARVIGKQTQTFLEWRDDFHRPGLGTQYCQDCHMPRTTRKTAEDFDVPQRAVARHLWTGGHSPQRVRSALSVVVEALPDGEVKLHVINIGAGHSVPTGSNRRAVYLRAELSDPGRRAAAQSWMFAPYYAGRPDDRQFLDADRELPDSISAIQADSQGPHEAPIRAGEERVLSWKPEVRAGKHKLHVTLVYDINRYNPVEQSGDQTALGEWWADIVIPISEVPAPSGAKK